MAKNPVFHARTKYIECHYHFFEIRWCQMKFPYYTSQALNNKPTFLQSHWVKQNLKDHSKL
jgi:hypothetical protein